MDLRRKGFFLIAVIGVCLAFLSGLAMADEIDNEISQMNQTIQAEGLPWTAGRTSVMDLAPEDRKALLGGPMEPVPLESPTLDVSEEGGNSQEPYSGEASATWDWRDVNGHNWMTPVTNQMCGDCWAHGTLGSMEARLRWQRGGSLGYQLPINLSERYAVTCSPHGSCSNWNVPSLLAFIQSEGVPDEDCLPYSSSLDCADRCSNWSHRVYKVLNYGTYSGSSFMTNVMNSCEYNGPIVVWMMVYSDFWGYSGGIYVKSAGATEEGGHYVDIIGWGSSGGVNYWICKNSWGTGWGVNGYFYIRRGTNESRIEERAYWLTPQYLSNLDDSTPTGWDYPIVPRGDNTATSSSAHVSPTLPGNSNSTYWNVNWKNEGIVEARDNVTHLSVDDIYSYGFSISFQPAGYETKHINNGTSTVKGGRHTLCLNTIDFDDRVWEYDEGDNTYCHQFVWSPYALSDDTPITRTAPPKKDSLGYSWYNSDGFSFLVQHVYPNKYWSAVGVLPSNSGADYDVRLYDIGTYTGSQGGFGTYLKWSSYGKSNSDFVIVNNNTAVGGTYYAGVINYNEGTGNFRIEEDTTVKIFSGTNGPYSKTNTNVLDTYECYLSAAGDWGFKLEQTSGTCDLGMSLYDDETVTAQKDEYMTGGYANSTGDGGDESMQVTIPDPGYHCLVVWKVDSSDYDKPHAYKIKMGKCATPSTPSNPSPADAATNVSVNADLNWGDCTDTEYYKVWLREGSGSWVQLGQTETSAWTLPTLNEGTHYDWYITAWNICGAWSSVYWEFTTEDNTAPTPNPMTWATPPYQTGTASICMTGTTASDPSPPITYYMHFVSSPTGGTGGTSSAWQSGTSYCDTGLSTNHQYGYRVYARDGSLNVTTPSAATFAYTAIEIPTGITFGTITSTSIQARSTSTPSGLTRGGSGLFISNLTAGTSSGWKQDNNYWTSSSLLPNTQYTFRARARNGDKVSTPWSGTADGYTLAVNPGAAAFSNITCNSIQANWTANGNPPGTEYYCENTTAGTNSGWTTNTHWNSTGLSENTAYGFRVKARNAKAIETGWTNLGSQTTPPCADICECDLNQDGRCDMQDWLKFGEDWGRTDCSPRNPCECDLNQDGRCDMQDWLKFGEDWGRTDCPIPY